MSDAGDLPEGGWKGGDLRECFEPTGAGCTGDGRRRRDAEGGFVEEGGILMGFTGDKPVSMEPARRRGLLDVHLSLDADEPELPAPAAAGSGAQVTRDSLNGEVEWGKVDRLELAHADRRAAAIQEYKRPVLAPQGVDDIKVKWQRKQVKRMSRAAELFGARESQKDLWDFIAVKNAAKAASSMEHHKAREAEGAPQRTSRRHAPFCVQQEDVRLFESRPQQQYGSLRLSSSRDAGARGSSKSSSGRADDDASAAATARPGAKRGVSLKKQLTSVFNQLWGPPQDAESVLQALAKKAQHTSGKRTV